MVLPFLFPKYLIIHYSKLILFFVLLPLIICPNSFPITAATSLSLPVYDKSVLEIYTTFVVDTFELSATPFTTLNVVVLGRPFFSKIFAPTDSQNLFIFETLVCLIQIISMVYFHKKVFLMTPFHHHLEKLGWNERDIVVVFWCIGLLLSMAAIVFGVWY